MAGALAGGRGGTPCALEKPAMAARAAMAGRVRVSLSIWVILLMIRPIAGLDQSFPLAEKWQMDVPVLIARFIERGRFDRRNGQSLLFWYHPTRKAGNLEQLSVFT